MSQEPGAITTLRLTLHRNQVIRFFPLFQQGARIKVQTGCSIRQILWEQFGLSAPYLKTHVQTVFLDGTVVDELDTAIVNEGSIMALSAAMPGLVGATLRSGGPIASFRSQITHRKNENPITQGDGMVIVKIFNLLLHDLVPIFLERGFYVQRSDGADFFASLPQEFWPECKNAELSGERLSMESLRELQWLNHGRWFLIQVHFSDSPD